MIPWRLISILLSWLIVAVVVYEHDQNEFDQERAALKSESDKAKILTDQVSTILGSKVSELQANLTKAQADGKAQDEKIQSVAAAADYQLRPNAATCGVSAIDSAVAGHDSPQSSAQLSREAGDTLFDIATTGNIAIRDLNECISQYDEVKSQFDNLIAQEQK